MENPAWITDGVKAEAAAWLGRLRADDRSERDDLAFRKWLAASPQHAAAFEAVNTIWESAGALPRDLRGYHERVPSVMGRRALLAGVGTLVFAGSGLAFLRTSGASVYQTEVGEQKHIVLQDGSQAFLDTNTRLVARFSKALRSVTLQYGCVNFNVLPDAARPFVVSADNHKITTLSSNFDVRCNDGRLSVVLVHGRLAITGDVPGIAHDTLGPGERFVATPAASAKLDRPDLAPLLAWQTGQAIFRNEKLSDAITEMNRYSATKLRVVDAAAAGMRISGVYFVGDNVAFARSLAKLFPVSVHRSENGIDIAASERRAPG